MHSIDLNLLPVLHALLAEQHVTRAAERMYLSPPAMSRALDRCRRTFGDELLVRRGRGLVITPRGTELLAELQPLLSGIEALVGGVAPFDPAALRRVFTIRANEAVIAAVGSLLLDSMRGQAPHAELRFESETTDDLDALRDGRVDLAIGSYGETTRELHAEQVATERLVGVFRSAHPLAGVRMTVRRFANARHVVTSRRGVARGPLDDLLSTHGVRREIAAVVPSFSAALAMCAQSDLVTLIPGRLAAVLARGAGLALFEPPVALPAVDVMQLWHGRNHDDPAHRWLRAQVRAAAAAASAVGDGRPESARARGRGDG